MRLTPILSYSHNSSLLTYGVWSCSLETPPMSSWLRLIPLGLLSMPTYASFRLWRLGIQLGWRFRLLQQELRLSCPSISSSTRKYRQTSTHLWSSTRTVIWKIRKVGDQGSWYLNFYRSCLRHHLYELLFALSFDIFLDYVVSLADLRHLCRFDVGKGPLQWY